VLKRLEDLPRHELAASASTSTYALTMQVGQSTMESMQPGQQGQALGDARREELDRLAMTQQYIIGELSLWLAQLQATAPSEESACGFARLRLETEAAPLKPYPTWRSVGSAGLPAAGLPCSEIRKDNGPSPRQRETRVQGKGSLDTPACN
jgi:hypothetical protein